MLLKVTATLNALLVTATTGGWEPHLDGVMHGSGLVEK